MIINKFQQRNSLLKMILFLVLFLGAGSVVPLISGCEEKSELEAQESKTKQANLIQKADIEDHKKVMYAMQQSYREVAKKVLPVVVEINVVEVVRQKAPQMPFSPWDFFDDGWPFSDPDQGRQRRQPKEREFRKQGLGSGVLIKNEGNRHYVVTNSHVVGKADEISVRLNDGREYEAKIAGKDERTDLALVYFESREEIPVIELADSEDLMVGDIVFAVGNPLGFESSLTQGIISALGRRAQPGSQIADFTDYIQTDAAINPGNSGGALVDLEGRLVGINSWIASRSGGSNGIGFAIPVNVVKKASSDFIEKGKVVYGWLGVSIADVSLPAYENLVKDLEIEGEKGALVLNLFEDSPAAKGGILPGDLIIKANQKDIENSKQLTRVVGKSSPGDRIDFTVIRYGKRENATVKIESRQSEEEIAGNTSLWPGMLVSQVDQDLKERLEIPGHKKGLLIRNIIKGSAPDIAGFRQGDFITKINDSEVETVMDFYQLLNQADNEISFRVYRQGREILLGLVP